MMNKSSIGRVAIRREGDFVNFYWAEMENMNRAILLGSIYEPLLRRSPELFDHAKGLFTDAIGLAIKESLGTLPDSWSETPAPEHERAGRA